ncbi:MAG: D-alanyl-D-alanine carboxypeptidase family protein [Candidatus Paceibacterota bacterium]|jgi:D-alanyl-D-alanine carboxypeptidase
MKKITNWPVVYVSVVAILVIAGLAGTGFYFYRQFTAENLKLTQEKKDLENQIVTLQNNLNTTNQTLQAEQERNNAFADQISGLASTVGTLDKLSKTDSELLQKYSKVYFLNENYVPSNLATITSAYAFGPEKPLLIHANLLNHLNALMQAVLSSGIDLKIASAYRSFGTQADLKAQYSITYGTGANKFSADQGYSEHQLGTALDFISASDKTLTIKFADTPAGQWLVNNAYRYGFIMSYPKGNDYYQYEPWHWRYIGVALATRLHNEGRNFYNYPQRTIDEYLVNIFD